MPDTDRSRSLQAVFVLGPSSSGKTTLCNAVARDLQVESELYIREIARNVMKTQGFTRNDTHTYEMQEAIMLAQLRGEQKAVNYASDVDECKDLLLLSDRSAIDPVVYAATSNIPDAAETRERLLQIPLFQQNLQFYRESLFIILPPVAEWIVDDGIRSLQDPVNYNAQLCRILAELSISFVVIPQELKDLDERVAFVKSHLAARSVFQCSVGQR